MPNCPRAIAAHVTGVRLNDSEILGADLVIDAMGRRSKLTEWLEMIGAPTPHVESEDSGFVYYTQYFKGSESPVPSVPHSHRSGRSPC